MSSQSIIKYRGRRKSPMLSMPTVVQGDAVCSRETAQAQRDGMSKWAGLAMNGRQSINALLLPADCLRITITGLSGRGHSGKSKPSDNAARFVRSLSPYREL